MKTRAAFLCLALLGLPCFSWSQNTYLGKHSIHGRPTQMTDERRQQLKTEVCDAIDNSFFYRTQKQECLKTTAGLKNFISPPALKYCLSTLADQADCFQFVENKDIDENLFSVCKGVASQRKITPCLRFFLESESIFHAKAAALCFKATEDRAGTGMPGSLARARSCLNMIRDRDIDLSKIEKCERLKNSTFGPDFHDCVAEATDKTPLLKELLCSKKGVISKTDPHNGSQKLAR